jgi:hypothetical protein
VSWAEHHVRRTTTLFKLQRHSNYPSEAGPKCPSALEKGRNCLWPKIGRIGALKAPQEGELNLDSSDSENRNEQLTSGASTWKRPPPTSQLDLFLSATSLFGHGLCVSRRACALCDAGRRRAPSSISSLFPLRSLVVPVGFRAQLRRRMPSWSPLGHCLCLQREFSICCRINRACAKHPERRRRGCRSSLLQGFRGHPGRQPCPCPQGGVSFATNAGRGSEGALTLRCAGLAERVPSRLPSRPLPQPSLP